MTDKNHVVLVTGATKGIGRAISEELASNGYHVIGIARNTDSVVFPGDLFACDLANIAQTHDVISQIANNFDISGVVNNVGIASPQPLGEIDLATLQNVLDLNVRASVQITQLLINGMKARNFGRIVNICSRAIFGARDRTAYSAAKAALVGCTRTWALELASYGITSNAVAPGPIETELFRQARPVGSDGEKKVLATIPVGRLGSPEEVASAVRFLLSDSASFISGQTLGVDGAGSLGGR